MSKLPLSRPLAMPNLPVARPAEAPRAREVSGLNPQLTRRIPEILERLRGLTEQLRKPLDEVALLTSELQDYLQFEIEKATLAAALKGAADDDQKQAIATFATTMDRVDPAEVRGLLSQIELLARDIDTNYAAPIRQLKNVA